MLCRIREKLDPDDQQLIDSTLSGTENSVNKVSAESPRSLQSGSLLQASQPYRQSSTSAQRYLGEVSDVSFFNSVKELLQTNATGQHGALQMESYEREAADSSVDASEDYLE